jgi:hypothetical protein
VGHGKVGRFIPQGKHAFTEDVLRRVMNAFHDNPWPLYALGVVGIGVPLAIMLMLWFA